jgi:hypothetical protein
MIEWMQANSIWVAAVLTALVFVYFIIAIVQALRKKPPATGPIGIILLSIGLIFAIFLLFRGDELEAASLAQMILTIGLLMITAAYASSAEKQAKASVEMAKEMQEQRYSECLPLLIPAIIPAWNTQGLAPNEVPYEFLKSGIGIKVMWCNSGKGTAVNSRFSFWTEVTPSKKATLFPPLESISLEVGGKKEVDYREILDEAQSKDASEGYKPRLEAEYQDIYERKITTVQEFRIEDQGENQRAFIGALYFTINGIRLGTEVKHD